jgi:hypothetical protein
MFVKPYTAFVGSPREVLRGGIAWKARKTYELASMRYSRGRSVCRFNIGSACRSTVPNDVPEVYVLRYLDIGGNRN